MKRLKRNDITISKNSIVLQSSEVKPALTCSAHLWKHLITFSSCLISTSTRSIISPTHSSLRLFQAYDATVLAAAYSGPQLDILIDQGRDDQFLSASQLLPDNLIAVCSEKKIPVVFRLQPVSSCRLSK